MTMVDFLRLMFSRAQRQLFRQSIERLLLCDWKNDDNAAELQYCLKNVEKLCPTTNLWTALTTES